MSAINKYFENLFKRPATIASVYKHGTEGHDNLFIRPEGHVYEDVNGEEWVSRGEIVHQWGGSPDFDSGYAQASFPLTKEGLEAAFNSFEGE